MQVVWKYYYSTKSAGEHGTMYQLRNLIGRSNVNADPVHKFNECDDFFKLVVTCHILVAALQFLKMKALDDIPSLTAIEQPQDFWMETTEKRKAVLQSICRDFVDEYAAFQFNKPSTLSTDKVGLA